MPKNSDIIRATVFGLMTTAVIAPWFTADNRPIETITDTVINDPLWLNVMFPLMVGGAFGAPDTENHLGHFFLVKNKCHVIPFASLILGCQFIPVTLANFNLNAQLGPQLSSNIETFTLTWLNLFEIYLAHLEWQHINNLRPALSWLLGVVHNLDGIGALTINIFFSASITAQAPISLTATFMALWALNTFVFLDAYEHGRHEHEHEDEDEHEDEHKNEHKNEDEDEDEHKSNSPCISTLQVILGTGSTLLGGGLCVMLNTIYKSGLENIANISGGYSNVGNYTQALFSAQEERPIDCATMIGVLGSFCSLATLNALSGGFGKKVQHQSTGLLAKGCSLFPCCQKTTPKIEEPLLIV